MGCLAIGGSAANWNAPRPHWLFATKVREIPPRAILIPKSKRDADAGSIDNGGVLSSCSALIGYNACSAEGADGIRRHYDALN